MTTSFNLCVQFQLAPLHDGDYPGTSAKCACADPILKTGLLCQLDCLGAPDFCGQGACEHTLMGKTYSEATAAERAGDAAYCTCDFGWAGAACGLPCPGGPNSTVSPAGRLLRTSTRPMLNLVLVLRASV